MNIPDILSKMTLGEKVSLCSGSDSWHTKSIERLGVPSIMMADGPHGLRREKEEDSKPLLKDSYPSTCFPTASALASTWNRRLLERIGMALGEECLAAGVHVILGPGINIKRSPLCGRNFEYFSEDPFLSGEMAAAMICGTQRMGVGSSLKHYAANNQEYRRMLIDAVIDERALREIYLAGFEIAIKKAQPWTIMAAYNKVNGFYCTENISLLKEILRDEWGFKGLVMSDWGAVDDRVRGLAAGMDLEMPGVPNGNQVMIENAVKTHQIGAHYLDETAERLLHLVEKCTAEPIKDFVYDQDAHDALAEEAAGEGAVLLKNEEDLLPINEGHRIAVIGAFAANPRYQGSGSSLIHPTHLDTLVAEIAAIAGEDHFTYSPGNSLTDPQKDKQLILQAVETARTADRVVVCIGLTDMDEVEGLDREHMCLPESHNRLVDAVVNANPNTIVLLSNGSPVEMPWIHKVPAVLEGYLGGQAGARAHAALLYGRLNPSGKLAESFPIHLEDNPSFPMFPGGPTTVEYRESIYVGYRFYDSVKKDILFPFGHGLSYTTFSYSGLNLNKKRTSLKENLVVSFKVKNIGKAAGKETVQVYVHDKRSSVFRAYKELKGFEKVHLRVGEEKTVTIELDQRAFSFYNVKSKEWSLESGDFEILIGASSRDIRMQTDVTVIGKILSQSTEPEVYSHFPRNAEIDGTDFEALLGRITPKNSTVKRPYSLNTPIIDMRGSFIGRILEKIIRKQIGAMFSGQPISPVRLIAERSALENPIRVLLMFSGGSLHKKTLQGLLYLANGKIWRGLRKLLER